MKITCRVLLFAELAERIGARHLDIEVDESATVATAMDQLAAAQPDVAAMRDRLAVAVNDVYARPDQPLRFGDELALIPPVSGG